MITVGPVFVTVEPPRTAKSCAEPRIWPVAGDRKFVEASNPIAVMVVSFNLLPSFVVSIAVADGGAARTINVATARSRYSKRSAGPQRPI